MVKLPDVVGDVLDVIPNPWDDNPVSDVFDTIRNWISGMGQSVISGLSGVIHSATSTIISALNVVVGGVTSTVVSWVGNVVDWVKWVGDRMQSGFQGITAWIVSTGNSTISHVTSIVSTWIGNAVDWVKWVGARLYNQAAAMLGTITSAFAYVQANILVAIGNLNTLTVSVISRAVSGIQSAVSLSISGLTSMVSAMSNQVAATLDWLAPAILSGVSTIVSTGWDVIKAGLFEFVSWVPKLFDAVADWLNVDVPGHSPRWTAIFDGIGHWFTKWFYEFPKYFFGDLPGNTAYGLAETWKWLTGTFGPALSAGLDALTGYAFVSKVTVPGMAKSNFEQMTAIAITSMTALFGMTIAGETLQPLKNMGLGNVAAIIYDQMNYKQITQSFMGPMTEAMIHRPAMYYFNDLHRPYLPSVGEALSMFAEEEITRAEASSLLGYHGFADTWHDKFLDSSYRRVPTWTLQDMAQSGAIDEKVYARELLRGGYSPEIRKLLMDGYKKSASANAKTVMVSAATTRYKLGMTDQVTLEDELRILNVGDNLIPLYVFGANIAYATDYTQDMIVAYQDAVRNSNMSLAEFRTALLALGLVPNRVEGYVYRERVRIKPKQVASSKDVAVAFYTTDAGKIRLDTIRRQRRKGVLTRDQEQSALLDIGMDNDTAAIYADNDDARLGEKASAS